MNTAVKIVGQGIAGTMLGWACERRGIDFEIVDRGHAGAATRVGAGLVSPLTGLRLAPTWRFAEWAERAQDIYRELEEVLGVELVRSLRLRRIYRDEQQRERMEARLDRPEVAAWVESADRDGVWMRGAFQVDTAKLIAAMRARWRASGQLREGLYESGPGGEKDDRTILCVGAAVRGLTESRVSWEISKGELLAGRLPGVARDVVLNDGQWVLPLGGADDRVRVGATFVRDDLRLRPTAAAETSLRAAAERLAGRPLLDMTMDVGLRVNVPDRRPVAGWWDAARRSGIFAGLAAKGALWAPVLAEQWAEDGLRGMGLDGEVYPNRFEK